MAKWQVRPAGGISRKGRWQPPSHLVLVTLTGGMDLDFTEAELPSGTITVTKVSLTGGVTVTVPSHLRVEASCAALAGGVREDEPPPGPRMDKDATVLRIRAFGLAGGVRVKRAGT
jgi:hypothetical protein